METMTCFTLNYEPNPNQVKLEQTSNETTTTKDKAISETMTVPAYCIYANKENEMYLLIMIMYLRN